MYYALSNMTYIIITHKNQKSMSLNLMGHIKCFIKKFINNDIYLTMISNKNYMAFTNDLFIDDTLDETKEEILNNLYNEFNEKYKDLNFEYKNL